MAWLWWILLAHSFSHPDTTFTSFKGASQILEKNRENLVILSMVGSENEMENIIDFVILDFHRWKIIEIES